MCGILGAYPGCELNINYLLHRGPDSNGTYIDSKISMGHTRLAILDLTSRGSQPIWSSNKDVLISYNGEIYNYLTLGSPYESCDTVALTEWIANQGVNFNPAYLDGMYAFAAYFPKIDYLVLCRDPAGIKPLYIAIAPDQERIGFSSEIKGFFGFDWFVPEPNRDPEDQRDFLQYGYSFPKSVKITFRNYSSVIPLIPTLMNNVFQVCPGQKILFSLSKKTHYTFTSVFPRLDFENQVNPLELLRQSVQEQSISDVNVGVQLSGGIDSSLVAYEYAKNNPEVHGFYVSVNDNNHNEDVYANHAAKIIKQSFDFKFHKINADITDVKRVLPSVIWHMDEPPIRHSNAIGIYLLCEYVKKNTAIKVLLTGEGADEIFGGYQWHDGKTIINYDHSRRLFDMGGSKIVTSYINQYPEKSILARQLLYDRSIYLPPILLRQDKMSMAHSIETRVPYLSNRFLTMAVPLEPRKIALRKRSTEIFGKKFTERPKCGFGFPYEWFEDIEIPNGSLDWIHHKVKPNNIMQQWTLSVMGVWADLYLFGGWKSLQSGYKIDYKQSSLNRYKYIGKQSCNKILKMIKKC